MSRRPTVLSAAVLIGLVLAGLASAAYVLVRERAPVPFRDTYEIKVDVSAAHGIQPGLGQPVRVAGVTVGSVADLDLLADKARVTLSIDRSQLPRVHRNARASLRPITPLQDMEVVLSPGRPPSPVLPDGGTLGSARSTIPVPLSQLLSSLDGDTRTFFASMLASLRTGTDGRGEDLRGALRALAPTTRQVRAVTTAMAGRRRELARLVHNVSRVTRAAAGDDDLAELVVTSHRTLRALAEQEAPLRETVARIPGALETTGEALEEARTFARELRPALTSLTPAVRGLPRALNELRPFADVGRQELGLRVRPFVRTAAPALRSLSPAIAGLRRQTPALLTDLKGLNYMFNELAYNPPGQKLGYDDEGFLFWAPWFAHNYNSTFSAKDAHGGGARGQVMVSCQQLFSLAGFDEILKLLVPTYSLCPEK